MSRNPIALAIPFFFLCIGIELLVARLARRPIYRLNDAFADLGCGIVQQGVGLLYRPALLAVYVAAFGRLRLVEIEAPAAVWVVGLVGVDFFYYWWHRASYRVNALWAAHVVHHQSEDMNLAVALRQAPLTAFTILPFYLPLALVAPPVVFASSAAINTLYQFWIHTDLIPKLGPLEWVFNTPSHHRAHHGINPRYIDKNYGGILIIWDRLFGTFAEETETVVYGIVEPLRSFDPLRAQVEPWIRLARGAWHAPGLLDKIRLWLAPPEWAPAGAPPHLAVPVTPESRPKWDRATSRPVAGYVLLQLASTVVATFLLLVFQDELGRRDLVLVVAAVLATLFASAALLEGRRWAWPVEVSRLVAVLSVMAAVLVS